MWITGSTPVTVVNAAMHFLLFKDGANGRSHSLFTKTNG